MLECFDVSEVMLCEGWNSFHCSILVLMIYPVARTFEESAIVADRFWIRGRQKTEILHKDFAMHY